MPIRKSDKLQFGTLSAVDIDRIISELSDDWKRCSPEESADMDRELNAAYPNGFTKRDVANALMVISGRKVSMENLHAVNYSNHITRDQMKLVVLHAIRLSRVKAKYPDFYNRLMESCGRMSGQHWEREQ
jgi:hypothetical protein